MREVAVKAVEDIRQIMAESKTEAQAELISAYEEFDALVYKVRRLQGEVAEATGDLLRLEAEERSVRKQEMLTRHQADDESRILRDKVRDLETSLAVVNMHQRMHLQLQKLAGQVQSSTF